MICLSASVVLFRDTDVFTVSCTLLKKEDTLVSWKEKTCNLTLDICIRNYTINMYICTFLLLVELRLLLFTTGDAEYKTIIICLR